MGETERKVQIFLKEHRVGQSQRQRQVFADALESKRIGLDTLNEITLKVLSESGRYSDFAGIATANDRGRLWVGVDPAVGESSSVVWAPEESRISQRPGFSYFDIAPLLARGMEAFAFSSFSSAENVVQNVAFAREVCVITPAEEAAEKPSMDLPRVSPATSQACVDEMTAELAIKAERLLGYSPLRQRLKLPSPLAQILQALEIEPFDQKAVDAYKLQAKLYRTKVLKQKLMARSDFDQLGAWWVRTATSPRWVRSDLAAYEGEIPPHVLSVAVSIAEYTRDWDQAVGFHVDHLSDDPDPFLVVECDGEVATICVWDEGFERNL